MSYYGGQWSSPKLFQNGNMAAARPALFVLNGKLYCVHRGHGNSADLWWCQFQGDQVDGRTNWSADNEFTQGNLSAAAPAAIEFNGIGCCVHRGGPDQHLVSNPHPYEHLWYCTFDGSSWSEDIQFAGGNLSRNGPALAVLNFS